jgi:hypothetical protein
MADRGRFVQLLRAAVAANSSDRDQLAFDAVVDFTGFHRDILRDTLEALHVDHVASEGGGGSAGAPSGGGGGGGGGGMGVGSSGGRGDVAGPAGGPERRCKVGHYVYISTDSVYMGSLRPFPSLCACEGVRAGGSSDGAAGSGGLDGVADGIERLVETDCVPPTTREQRAELKRWNSYQ